MNTVLQTAQGLRREDLSEEVENLMGFSKRRPQSGGKGGKIIASLVGDHGPRLERPGQLCLFAGQGRYSLYLWRNQ